jgi:hypothetical protein
MNDSVFNPDTFLDQSVEAPFDTVRTTIPPGDSYMGVIDNAAGRQIETKTGAQRIVMDVSWEVLDDNIRAQLNLSKIIVRQTVWLDYDENGKLAKGVNQNVQLGQLRDAIGQNGPGAWSPRMLVGAGPARLKISERVDEKNPAIKYNDVDRVSRLS